MSKDEKKTKSFNWWLIIIPISLVLVFIIGSTPSTVTFQTEEQVQVEKPLSYQVVDSKSSTSFSISKGTVAKGYVDISNTDTQPGTFVVNCVFKTLTRSFNDNDRIYVLPGETKRANCEADISLGEDTVLDYDITPSTKTVTETRTVTKEKQVPLYQKILGTY